LSVGRPTVPAHGLIVFASGGTGGTWWSSGGATGPGFLSDLRRDGFVTVELSWPAGWPNPPTGDDVGPAHMSCRPATAFRWIYDNLYTPLAITARLGECGFCLTGQSGGSSQVTYPLSHYGLDPIVDGVFPTGGPTHSAQRKGCLRDPSEKNYWYDDVHAAGFDRSYGYSSNGPCVLHDPAFASRWDTESVDTGGSRYVYPRTRVHLVNGTADTLALSHAVDYVARLNAEGSPWVESDVVDMPHEIWGSPTAMGDLAAALRSRALPRLSVGDASVSEGSTTATLSFPVTLSPAFDQAVSVHYSTHDGSAVAPADYVPADGTLTFAPGQVSSTANVTVNGDTAPEQDETLTLDLSSPDNAVIVDGSGVGTIVNDDGAVPGTPLPSVYVGDAWGLEGSGSLVFPLSLSAAPASPVSVVVKTMDTTAKAASDYAAVSSTTVSFAAGQTSASLPVALLDDALGEGNETFTVSLSSPSGVVIGDSSATGTIVDEEGPLQLSVDDPWVVEGNSGSRTMVFSVRSSSPVGSGQSVSVSVQTADGTATTANGDYTTVPLTTVSFAAGDTVKTVAVTVTGDTTVEPDETLTLKLSSPKGAVIVDGSGVGTIVNDD